MIFFLIEFLKTTFGIKVPSVFEYYSTRMILAALTAFVFSLFFGPFFLKKLYELRIGQIIRIQDAPLLGQLHQKKQNTPTMGGLLILFAMLLSLLFWMDLHNVFTWILFLTTLVLGFMGGYDDYLKLKYQNTKGLSARKKIIVQSLLGAFLATYLLLPSFQQAISFGEWLNPSVIKSGQTVIPLSNFALRLYIPFIKEPLLFSPLWAIPMGIFFICVITGSSNAVNLTDGLDGLASGCLIMVASALIVFAFLSNHVQLASYLHIPYIEGSGEIAIYLCAFVGACLGFLWYNGYPAQVFMGDIGSLTLGGILGVSAILLKRELLFALIGGVFVAETLSVILQVTSYKYRNKKRIFLCTPLHHHFEYKGWPETKVVIRFWIIGLILALIGIVSLKLQ